jgi:hypothetical protein
MAEEKNTTSLNKARVEELLGFIKQTFYSQADHEQSIKDFNAWWLSILGQPNGVPKTDANNKILQGFFPDYILGQLLWGGTISGNDKISPSTHLSSKIDIVDESISSSNVAKYTGIYFIATADANTSGSIVNSLDVRTGDWVISTGVEWVKIDNTDAVRSVADYVGSITAEELRNRLVGQYKDGETYKNYALGTMHYADGSGKALQLTTTEFARSILGGIASQSVFSGLYADKAQTLLNKRNLWGNNFDGSADIGGQLIPFENGNSDIGSQKIQFRTIYLKSYVWLGSEQEGIYLDKSGIYLHNSDNSYKGMVMKFDESGNTTAHHNLQVIGATTLKSTLSVVGATTLQSTLLVKDLATFEKNILLANANTIGFKHTDGQSNINLLSLTENNEARFGYGTLAKGLTSTIYGKEIQFKTKDSLNNDAVIDDNGNFHSYHDISATGGVSASGVNDFGIGGGSVGTGGKTYKLTKIDGVTNTTLELSATDGSQTETIAFNQFGSSFAGIVPATNGAPKTSVLSTEGWRILTANDIPSLDWSKITTGKPTTLGGYGITDAFTKSQIENGVFPNMRVGLADDLGDIEETLDEEYTFQPTANPNEIRDGYAQIESLKGNSLVWNQWAKVLSTSNGITFTQNADGSITATGVMTSEHSNITMPIYKKGKVGHKFLLIDKNVDYESNVVVKVSEASFSKPIGELKETSVTHFQLYISAPIGQEISFTKHLYIIDLTQMFGEGNEPTTVEEFERRCPKGMSNDYNEGQVIHFNGDAVKSVGFNQWDEEWENKWINNTGTPINAPQVASKNFIRVLENTSYYIDVSVHTSFEVHFYDLAYNHISKETTNRSFTTPDNCSFIKFNTTSAYGTTYNHDICINLSDPDKNGTYEPYTEFRRDLPTELFDGGMKSAGTAHDEIYWDKAKGKYIKVTRITSAKFKDFTWVYLSEYNVFATTESNRINNAICNRYASKWVNTSSLWTNDKTLYYGHGTRALAVMDSSYTDIESFLAAMGETEIVYQLAEPIVEEIDIPYMDYQVSNDGTEEIVSDMPTTPIKARVTYNFDTIGTVRQNRFDVSNLKTSISNLSKGIGVSGNWVLDGLKIGTYDVLHKGNTSLVIDKGDNFGFTLKVADTEIQMSDITEDELREMINTAWGTNYEA